jgi:single-strand DNA-binding protein
MAGSVNKVTLIGNVGRDPEVRRTSSGDPVVNFSIATSETWRDRQTGERKERTEWHNIVIFNENLAKVAEQYVRKGSKIYVEGALQTRKFQDKNGQERQTTEVVLQKYRGELTLLDGRSGGGDDRSIDDQSGGDFGRSSPMERRPASSGASGGSGRQMSDLDDDIPF